MCGLKFRKFGAHVKLFILGSCVSRDAVEYAAPGEIQLIDYVARSSIGSMFAGQPFEDLFSHKVESKFLARQVRMDIEKGARYQLAVRDADIILIDLIDERYDLVQTEPWKFCTASGGLMDTGALRELKGITVIPSGSAIFMRYWIEGWRCLMELLDKKGARQKIRVNKVFLQNRTVSGATFPNLRADYAERINDMISGMYAHMSADLDPHQFYEYDPSLLKCTDVHRWTPAPFHYHDSLYEQTVEHLRETFASLPQSAVS